MPPVDNYTADVVARLRELFDPRIQWQRSLWDVGLVLAMRELHEASEGVLDGALSASSIKWLASSIRGRIGADPGVGPEAQRKAINDLLSRDQTAGGTNHRELRLWTDDLQASYLRRWRAAVAAEDRPPRELTARALAGHLLDAGNSPERLGAWLRDIELAEEEVDAASVFQEAESLLGRELSEFSIMVVFDRPPAAAVQKPGEWRDASAVSSWIADAGFEPVRQHGGLLLTVPARDAHAAAAIATDVIERLAARGSVGTRRELSFGNDILVLGHKVPLRVQRRRRAEVRALEREGQLLTVDAGGPIDAALELLSHLNSAAAPVAVAGGWSAVESLLSAPGDEDKVITADRLAYLVACSWPRAELTTLAWARINQCAGSPDALAKELADLETNRARAERLLRALTQEEELGLEDRSEKLAIRRMEQLVRAPIDALIAVQRRAGESFRRLYRQRNRVLHGGRTSGVALRASVRTSAPLVGAGIDRITHASLVGDVEPLELAARARVEVERAGTEDAPALTALLES